MHESSRYFATTHWTCVMRAKGDSAEAREALNELCTAYYSPIQAFMRQSARRDESPDDLTQEFFTRVLTGRAFHQADPERGRFRSYLLGAVKHFLADVRDRGQTLKRGAGAVHIPLDPGTDTSAGVDVADRNGLSPEEAYQKQWALTLLDRALHRLQTEMEQSNKSQQFEILKPWLTGDASESQRAASTMLGMTENALKVAIHRLRRRFRELVTAEIAQTVVDPAEQELELNELIAALGR